MSSNAECCLHFENDVFSNKTIFQFTQKTLKTAIDKAHIWRSLSVQESEIAGRLLAQAVGESSVDPSDLSQTLLYKVYATNSH